jgi:hypothetical protein
MFELTMGALLPYQLKAKVTQDSHGLARTCPITLTGWRRVMAGRMARREAGAMPLRIVTDEATPPDDPPRACPRGLRRLSPAAASRRSGQYRRGYSLFACSLRQTKIIRNATPSGFGIGSKLENGYAAHGPVYTLTVCVPTNSASKRGSPSSRSMERTS